jgi:hypothetical protein
LPSRSRLRWLIVKESRELMDAKAAGPPPMPLASA